MAATIGVRTAPSSSSALLDVFHQADFRPVRGEGPYLFTSGGERYLDLYGGHAVALLGYGHPRLLAALEEQSRTLFFQSNLFPLPVRERAAASLARFGPEGLNKIFFVNSGAEANENALRVAFLATGRKTVVAVEGAFHGRTAAAAAVTWKSQAWCGFPRAPFNVCFVPFDDLGALEGAVTEDVAAVIVEPVQGVAGARAMSRAFLEAARSLSASRGALLIFDEVQCGTGRSGWPFVAQAVGITPDILTTAKGLGGGFPVGAVMVAEALGRLLKKGDLGTTFGGGPMAAALVEATLRTLEEEDLLHRVRRLSERLVKETRVGPVTDVQGMGFLLGLRTAPPAKEVLAALRGRRILAGGSADPNVVRLLPPLILEDRHVDELVAALREIPA